MKHSIIRGTVILTIAGLLTRVLGFFYKVFLAHRMTPQLLGLYQLIAPVYGLCFTIYASGIQTAVSKQVAEALVQDANSGSCRHYARAVLLRGLTASLTLATLLSLALYAYSVPIATYILSEPSAAPSLRILCIMFPFCSITACLNGYFYGCRITAPPATTQLSEQISRIAFVLITTGTLFHSFVLSHTVSCELAVLGLVLGEIVAALVASALFLFIERKTHHEPSASSRTVPVFSRNGLYSLLALAFPLTANHLILSLLHSYETILIPELLVRNGLSNADALATLGVLTGMALPFLYFPTALTGALAILLLPTVSEANAKNSTYTLRITSLLTIRYTMLLGFLCTGLFLLFGPPLCTFFFGNATAGKYLQLLALLCPFLYAEQTIASILNGLSRTSVTFRNAIIGSSLQLIALALTVPRFGIYGYFISTALDLGVTLCANLCALRSEGYFISDWCRAFFKPLCTTGILLPFFLQLRDFTLPTGASYYFLKLGILAFIYIAFFTASVALLQCFSRRDTAIENLSSNHKTHT